LKPHLQAMNGKHSLAQRYLEVKARIERAAEAAGRDPQSVTLLAVSKTFPAADIRELAAAGQTDFGENYVQEALGKIAALAHLRPGWSDDDRLAQVPVQQAAAGRSRLQWHFIGPIQSNKTRRIAEAFDWVQSVNDERIARRLSEQRPLQLPPLQVCLQVNISREASKSGCDPDDVVGLAQAVAGLTGIRLRGLMAIPEATDDAALQAQRFSAVRDLFQRVRDALPGASGQARDSVADADGGAAAGFDTLSMGMSADLEAAVAQGATIVRIGSALFGERPKKP
jgi:pyridoxal phosphate enzyme (YggS family)